MIAHPKNAKKGLLGIAALAVVVVIAYAFASGEVLGIKNVELATKYDVPSTVKYAGMMINSIYILAIIAIVSMVYSEVSKIFK
jgi:amino acid permease